MDLKGAFQTEAHRTLVTPVGLLPRMSTHVGLQGAIQTETHRALVTLVGLLPGVSPHVAGQVAFPTEALHALVAPVRLLVGVDLIGLVGNNLSTQDTGPALAAALMPSQLLKADEPHAAVQALGHAVVSGQRAQGLQF